MSTVISSNMLLPVPVVGVETGPQWASDINNCFTVIDQHDHSAGAGVQVSPSGLNINTDLAMQNNSLTNSKAVVFGVQTSFTTNASLYVRGNEIYYRDVAGTEVQITNTGSVNAGAGSITGLPNGTAGVAYSAVNQTYTFESATSVAANLDLGSLVLRNLSPNSTFSLTVDPPAALGSNYNITLPTLPASKKIMTMSSVGLQAADYDVDNSTLEINSNTIRVKAGGITTTQIAAATITGSNIASATITGSNIAATTIGTGNMQAGSVNGTVLADASITDIKIAALAGINQNKLAVKSITAASVASGTASSGTSTLASYTHTSALASAPFLFTMANLTTTGVFDAVDSTAYVEITLGASVFRIGMLPPASAGLRYAPANFSMIGQTDGSSQATVSVKFVTQGSQVDWPTLVVRTANF